MEADRRKGLSRRTGPVAVAIVFFGMATLLLASSFSSGYQRSFLRFDPGPTLYPRILLVLMIVLSLIVIVRSLKLPADRVLPKGSARVLWLMATTVMYVATIRYFGFLIASVVFLILVPWTAGYRRTGIIVSVAGVYAVAIWLVFEKVLYIILPSSPWFTF